MYPLPLAIFIVCSLAALGVWLYYQWCTLETPHWAFEDLDHPFTAEELETLRKIAEEPDFETYPRKVLWQYKGNETAKYSHYEEGIEHKRMFCLFVLAAETYEEPPATEEPTLEEVSPYAYSLEIALEEGSSFLPYDLYNEWYSGEPFTSGTQQDIYMFLFVCAAEGVL